MKRKRFLIGMTLSVLLLWCASASAQDIKYNFRPGTDFAKYRTYKWVRVPKADYPNQILDARIMQSIDAQLGERVNQEVRRQPRSIRLLPGCGKR